MFSSLLVDGTFVAVERPFVMTSPVRESETARITSEAFVDELDAGQRMVVSSSWLGVTPCKHMHTACETLRRAVVFPLPPSQAAHSCYFLRPQLRMYCDGDSAVGSMPVRAVHACNARDPMPANADVASHILNGCQGGRGSGRWNPDDLNDGDVLHSALVDGQLLGYFTEDPCQDTKSH